MPRARAHAATRAKYASSAVEADGLPGSLIQSTQRALGVGVADRVEVEMPVRVERHRDGAAAGEHRAHLVARVRDRGIQHGVALRIAQAQQVRQRRDELLGADARADVRALDRERRTGAGSSAAAASRSASTAGRRRVAVRGRERVGRGAATRLRAPGRTACRSSSRRRRPAANRRAASSASSRS